MKHQLTLTTSAAALILCVAPTHAETATGPGGPIQTSIGVWPTVLPPFGLSSSVELQNVASVTSITLTGLSHTWAGDVHVILFDPDGNGYNILHRPGFTGAGFGSSADFDGSYVFVDPGRGPAFPSGGSFVQPGTYSQSFGVWPDGAAGVSNSPLSAINGPAGTWTLKVYDWAGADAGFLDGWTIEYQVPAPAALALLGLAGLASRRRR